MQICPWLQEYIDVARHTAGDKVIGIYPELKDPEWLNSLSIMNGNKFEDIVLDMLHSNGYTERSDRCFVQSFSEASLVYVAPRTRLPLIMLREVDAPNDTLARHGRITTLTLDEASVMYLGPRY